MLYSLDAAGWALLALAALFVGLSKTALPGVNLVSVVICAALIPARESTGALLVLLMVGDLMAIFTYRRHAHWPTLIRLMPAVLVGLLAGSGFLYIANDTVVQRAIGVLLLALMVVTLRQRLGRTHGVKREAGSVTEKPRIAIARSWMYGGLGGFSTMVANSGGPVMSMYFLAMRFEVAAFLGTVAWFFAVMNLLKLPFMVGMGLINAQTLQLDMWLLPAVLIGGLLGKWLISRINQQVFDRLIIWITVAGSLWLLFT